MNEGETLTRDGLELSRGSRSTESASTRGPSSTALASCGWQDQLQIPRSRSPRLTFGFREVIASGGFLRLSEHRKETRGQVKEKKGEGGGGRRQRNPLMYWTTFGRNTVTHGRLDPSHPRAYTSDITALPARQLERTPPSGLDSPTFPRRQQQHYIVQQHSRKLAEGITISFMKGGSEIRAARRATNRKKDQRSTRLQLPVKSFHQDRGAWLHH